MAQTGMRFQEVPIRMCEKPQCFKAIESEDLFCIEGFNEDGTYCYLGLDFMLEDVVMVHLEVTRWSHTILKSLLDDWEDSKNFMRKKGAKQAFTTREGTIEEHRRWLKFIKHFGFDNPQPQVTLAQEL